MALYQLARNNGSIISRRIVGFNKKPGGRLSGLKVLPNSFVLVGTATKVILAISPLP